MGMGMEMRGWGGQRSGNVATIKLESVQTMMLIHPLFLQMCRHQTDGVPIAPLPGRSITAGITHYRLYIVYSSSSRQRYIHTIHVTFP